MWNIYSSNQRLDCDLAVLSVLPPHFCTTTIIPVGLHMWHVPHFVQRLSGGIIIGNYSGAYFTEESIDIARC